VNLFITGTDTDVGKTYVTCLLLKTLRSAGYDAVGYKPVGCGDRNDAALLAEASGGLTVEEVNPVHFGAPLAPYVAGMLENRILDPEALLSGYRALARTHEIVIIEGAGGWEVPLTQGFRVSDLAKNLDLPVLLVTGNKLGALNHAVLTVEAVRRRGLICAGMVLNQLSDELDTAMITNKGVIEDLTGVPLIEHVIHGQDFLDSTCLKHLGLLC